MNAATQNNLKGADDLNPIILCRDRSRDASRCGLCSCLIVVIAIAGMLISFEQSSSVIAASPEKSLVSIEYVEPTPLEEPATPVEEAPSPVVEPEPPKEIERPVEPEVIKPEPVAVPIKVPKPKPVNKAKPVSKPAPVKPASLPSNSADKPKASASAPKPTNAQFTSRFISLVEKNKYYPKNARKAGLTGTVKVKVSFDGSGKVIGATLIPGDYHPTLGEAALTTINKAKNSWNPPGGGPKSLTIPINFKLN